jgi:hypothetical protein
MYAPESRSLRAANFCSHVSDDDAEEELRVPRIERTNEASLNVRFIGLLHEDLKPLYDIGYNKLKSYHKVVNRLLPPQSLVPHREVQLCV